MHKIKVVLPKKFDLVVGDTFQLFYRGIIEAPNPFCYDIVAVCEKGNNYPRYFEFTPDEEGEYNLTVSVYNADKKLLGSGETVLSVVKPTEPKKHISILCIGDSLTAKGQWVGELKRRLTENEGMPSGNGLSNIQFIGTCNVDGTLFEGYGGWKWDSYLTTTMKGIWITVENHNKTDEDQHSVWQDDNQNLWIMETVCNDSIKFMPYKHEHPINNTNGKFIHIKNASHQDDIIFTDIATEKPSPFLNKENNAIDFSWYCEKNGFEGVDGVYILLGWNCLKEGLDLPEHCRGLAYKAKEMIDAIHLDYPDAWVRILGLQVPSVNGGTGASYGAQLPYCDDYGLTKYVMELNRAYESITQEKEYMDFVEFINISGQFDSDYNMQSSKKPVNTRSKQEENIGINGVHPSFDGYMQIADAVYRNAVRNIANK